MPVTNFFWEPLSDDILQGRDEFGALTAEYATEPGLYGNVISQNRSGVESHFHFDAMGSTLAVTDDNQQITGTQAYSAFGDTTETTGIGDYPWHYIGRHGYYPSAELQQYVVRRRIYKPQQSRWLSMDPLPVYAFMSSVYASNNPLNNIDPSGLIKVVLAPNARHIVHGCGGFSIVLELLTTKRLAFTFPTWPIGIVKHSCISYHATYCRQPLQCAGGCSDFYCSYTLTKCCFYEAAAVDVGKDFDAGATLGGGDRIAQLPSPSPCPASVGYYKRSSDIRLFHLSNKDYIDIKTARGRGSPWNGRDVRVECDSTYGFSAAAWSWEPPPYWDAPIDRADPIAGRVEKTLLISSAPLTIAASWDCCSPNPTDELFINNTDVNAAAQRGPLPRGFSPLFSKKCEDLLHGEQ